MPGWSTIPTLNSIGASVVRSFAATIGISKSALHQSDWETVPYFPPTPQTSAEQEVVWEQQTHALYRVRTLDEALWLFWLAIKAWRKGELLPFHPEVVAHWHRADEGMITACSHRACLNPALIWPGPAASMTIQVFGHSHVLNFYGCGEAHRQALSEAETIVVELSTHGSSVGRDTIHLSREEATRLVQHQEISERHGRLDGCPYTQWIIEIPKLWREEEIAVVEATLRARLQEYTDRFTGEYNGFWRLSVSFNHHRFFARSGSTKLEAATAKELAAAIDQDYAALRASWYQQDQH